MGVITNFLGGNTASSNYRLNSIMPSGAVQDIMSGRLPRIENNNIFFKQGEYCCYMDNAVLFEDRKKSFVPHGGVSVPGPLKVGRLHLGAGVPIEYNKTEQYEGILYMTNRRVIFDCKDHGFDRPYSYLSSYKYYDDGIDFQFGNKSYSLEVPDGNVPYHVLKIVQNGSNY